MEYYSDEQAAYHEKHDKAFVNKGVFQVYFYFALGIFWSGVIALGLPSLIAATGGADAMDTYIGILIGSVIALIILGWVANLAVAAQHPAWIILCYILYASAFGALMSGVALTTGYDTLFYAFGITAGMFLLLSIIGYISKGRLNKWAYFAVSLVTALLVAAIFNIFLFGNYYLYWIVSYLMIFVFMLIAIVDTSRIMSASASGVLENNKAYAVYCAYRLYGDFMIILYYVAIFGARFLGSRR